MWKKVFWIHLHSMISWILYYLCWPIRQRKREIIGWRWSSKLFFHLKTPFPKFYYKQKIFFPSESVIFLVRTVRSNMNNTCWTNGKSIPSNPKIDHYYNIHTFLSVNKDLRVKNRRSKHIFSIPDMVCMIPCNLWEELTTHNWWVTKNDSENQLVHSSECQW